MYPTMVCFMKHIRRGLNKKKLPTVIFIFTSYSVRELLSIDATLAM